MKKIGVLLPHSKAYPRMSKEFMNGLRLSLGDQVEFKIEGIGLANDPNEIINAMQKLISQEDVDFLTGIMGHNNLSEILDFVEEMDVPFVFADLGAKCPLDLKNRKNIICNSLDLNGATKTLGNYFAEKGLNNIAISTSYYDAGYDFTFALETVINENPSIRFTGHFITPLNPRENEAERMRQFFKDNNPDAIFGFFNGIFAVEHSKFIEESQITKNIPMYLTPFSVDEGILKESKNSLDKQFCISPWFAELDTKENKNFLQGYQSKYNNPPDFFALLGFENGLILHDIIFKDMKINNDPSIGPRGSMAIDNLNKRTIFNHYLWQMISTENGYRKISVEMFDLKDRSNENYTQVARSGWENAYLCY